MLWLQIPFFSTNTAVDGSTGKCPSICFKTPIGFMLRVVEMQPRTAATGMAAFLPVNLPSSPPPLDVKVAVVNTQWERDGTHF